MPGDPPRKHWLRVDEKNNHGYNQYYFLRPPRAWEINKESCNARRTPRKQWLRVDEKNNHGYNQYYFLRPPRV